MIPRSILPHDGRFGSGPSRVRPEAVTHLSQSTLLGTSHRQAPVKNLVAHVQESLSELLRLPDGYEVTLGLGGATAFWDVATYSLVRTRAAHGVFGEFGNSFFMETDGAPFLEPSIAVRAEPGSCAVPTGDEDADVLAWPENETSTGVIAPVTRVSEDALIIVDGTSSAGGVEVDISQTDVYFFAPQKCFAADGGLWFAVLSPDAVARAQELSSARWIPRFFSLSAAIENSRAHQTLNTPAIATLELLAAQLDFLLDLGGLSAAAARSRESSSHIYEWAAERSFATPFVTDPGLRSPVVATIDFEGVDVNPLKAILRENGIVDVDAYRKLGRNQLRIGTFPAVDPDDVRALTASIDWVVEHLA